MITSNHAIAYRNVVSKLYQFYPEDLEDALTDFASILTEKGYTLGEAVFYAFLNDPQAELVTAEIFMTIEEPDCRIPEEDVRFNSYFLVGGMLMSRITDHFNEQSQVRYWELFSYMKEHNKRQVSPVFVEFKKAGQQRTYVEMSVAVK